MNEALPTINDGYLMSYEVRSDNRTCLLFHDSFRILNLTFNPHCFDAGEEGVELEAKEFGRSIPRW